MPLRVFYMVVRLSVNLCDCILWFLIFTSHLSSFQSYEKDKTSGLLT